MPVNPQHTAERLEALLTHAGFRVAMEYAVTVDTISVPPEYGPPEPFDTWADYTLDRANRRWCERQEPVAVTESNMETHL